eukprot:5698496-Prymnesium_polylepis.2
MWGVPEKCILRGGAGPNPRAMAFARPRARPWGRDIDLWLCIWRGGAGPDRPVVSLVKYMETGVRCTALCRALEP